MKITLSETQIFNLVGLANATDAGEFAQDFLEGLRGDSWEQEGSNWSRPFTDGDISTWPVESLFRQAQNLAQVIQESSTSEPDLASVPAGHVPDWLQELVNDILDDSAHIGTDVMKATITWLGGEVRTYEID